MTVRACAVHGVALQEDPGRDALVCSVGRRRAEVWLVVDVETRQVLAVASTSELVSVSADLDLAALRRYLIDPALEFRHAQRRPRRAGAA